MNRIVNIYVVDTDDKVPVDERLIEQRLGTFTDETDDALKMTLNLSEVLDSHNEYRATLKDDDDKPLKPIRISDLVVRIEPVATF